MPGLDSLNHRNHCPTQRALEPCPKLVARAPPGVEGAVAEAAGSAVAAAAERGEICVVVKAAAPVKAGEELCLSYGHLTPDLALFQYGFLLHR